jgi:hypothetical protein
MTTLQGNIIDYRAIKGNEKNTGKDFSDGSKIRFDYEWPLSRIPVYVLNYYNFKKYCVREQSTNIDYFSFFYLGLCFRSWNFFYNDSEVLFFLLVIFLSKIKLIILKSE